MYGAILRAKIESIIRRGQGQADPDCPEDPASFQFWVTRKASVSEKEKSKVKQQVNMSGAPGDGFADDLMNANIPVPARPGDVRTPALGGFGATEQLLQLSRCATSDAGQSGRDTKV